MQLSSEVYNQTKDTLLSSSLSSLSLSELEPSSYACCQSQKQDPLSRDSQQQSPASRDNDASIGIGRDTYMYMFQTKTPGKLGQMGNQVKCGEADDEACVHAMATYLVLLAYPGEVH